MTAQDIIDRAHQMARIPIRDTDPFLPAEWLQSVGPAMRQLWAVEPEAYFVAGRVTSCPAAPSSASGEVAMLDSYLDRAAAFSGAWMLGQMDDDGDQEYGVRRDKLRAELLAIGRGEA